MADEIRQRVGRDSARAGNPPPRVQARAIWTASRIVACAAWVDVRAVRRRNRKTRRRSARWLSRVTARDAQVPIVVARAVLSSARAGTPCRRAAGIARRAGGERSVHQSRAWRQISRRRGSRAHWWYQARRSGRPQGTARRRRCGDQRVHGSADRARACHRSNHACGAEAARSRGDERPVGCPREDRAGAIRGVRHRRVSRRDVHAAALLRHRRRLSDERHESAV